MNGAESLVTTLVDGGVEICFANPGTSEMHFLAALDNPRMKSVLCLFEGVCTGAADGWYRMRDKPASTLLHLGPGLANGLANIHNAKRASSGMVNIVGEHSAKHLTYDPPLTSDIEGLARPLSHWVRRAETSGSIAWDAATAITKASEHPGQIATLILPGDTAWQEAGELRVPAAAARATRAPDTARVEGIAKVLRSGEPTLLILANKATRGRALELAGKVASGSLAGQYENRMDGFGRNLFTGNEVQTARTYGGRVKLLWEPDARTKLTLSADANGRDAADPAFRNFDGNALGQNVTTQISGLGGDPKHDIYADVDPYLTTRAWGVSSTFAHDFGGVSLKSITAYRHSDFHYYFDPDGTTQQRIVVDNKQYDRQFTQELNLVGEGSGQFKWVLGGFYMYSAAGNDPARTTGLFTFGNNGYADNINRQTLHSYSGFAEGTYTIGASTHLTAGARYTSDDRHLRANVVSYNGNIRQTTATPVVEQEKTFDKVTYRLSLDHRFSPELLAYASYNRGFRTGAYIPQATPIVLLQPDTVDAYEVGLKTDLLDRRVRFNVAGYYYNEQNIQVQQVISGVNAAYNADGAHIYGVDADFTVRLTPNLRLFGGVNYTHARYTDFANAILSVPFPLPAGFTLTRLPATSPTLNAIIAPGQSAAQLCQGTLSPLNVTQGGNCLYVGDASGNRLQNTPEFTASVGGALDVPTASVGKFTLAGNVYYNDGFVGSPDERVRQRHYTTVDASLTWRLPGDKVFIRGWGRNLTDAFYRTQIGGTNSGDNGVTAAPRTYGGTLGFDF